MPVGKTHNPLGIMVDTDLARRPIEGRRERNIFAHRFSIFAPLAAFVTVTLLVATMGPFGTFFQGTFWDRLFYWAVANAASLLIAAALVVVQRRLFPIRSLFVREGLLCVVMTAVYTPLLLLWTEFRFPKLAVLPPSDSVIGVYVFLICVCISVLRYGVPFWLAQRSGGEMAVQEPEVTPEPLPRLLERFEADQRSPIVRMSVDGHKVIVVMEQQSKTLRMRFGDAVQELDGVDGFTTHRSHWVAASAVASVRTGVKRRPEIVLKNGDVVPVSRKNEPVLEERGLL